MQEKEESKTNSRVSFRLLDLEENFENYLISNNTYPSEAIRFFIKKGLDNKSTFFSIAEQKLLDSKLRAIDKHLSKMGVNLNQLAYYFNIFEKLDENALHKDLLKTQEMIWKFQAVIDELTIKLKE